MHVARRSSCWALILAACAVFACVLPAAAADDTPAALRAGPQLGPHLRHSEAIAKARADEGVQRELERQTKPGQARLIAGAEYVDGRAWEVKFSRHGEVRVQVDVVDATGKVTGVWTGHQIPWKMARGDRRAFGGAVNEPLLWWAMVLLFLVVMIDWRNWRTLATVDVGMLMAFTASHELFNQGAIEWSVPLAYPPLVWLFVRMAWLFARGVPARVGPPSWLPPFWVSIAVAVFLVGVRIGINHYGGNVVDVGYAGAAGAHEIVHGQLPYGHMPSDVPHGDTYGPLNYLLYVPALVLFGYDGNWGGPLPAAHVTAILADLAVLAGLFQVGRAWMSREAGAFLAVAWLVCPYSAFVLESNVNDSIIAAFLVWALVAIQRPWLRGALVGCAAMVKFVPLLAVAPLLHVGVAKRMRQFVMTSLGAVAVVAASAVFVMTFEAHGIRHFIRSTIGFQYDRESPFSVWGLYEWRIPQFVAQALLLDLFVAAVWWPRVRDARQVAAGMGAAMLGAQLVLQHWFYLYIPWFLAPMLIVLVAQREMRADRLAP